MLKAGDIVDFKPIYKIPPGKDGIIIIQATFQAFGGDDLCDVINIKNGQIIKDRFSEEYMNETYEKVGSVSKEEMRLIRILYEL